ncbi:MAG: VPS10 domain-containing protein [Bacteroidota bacterium]
MKRKTFIVIFLSLTTMLSSQDFSLGDNFSELQYRMVGPYRGGRVTAVAGIESQPPVFYMGATGGGVWKTINYGISWENVSDGFFHTGSIGSIRVAQSDPDIVYVGTGSDGIRSNVIIGKGMYRSDDAGKTWRFAGLPEAGQIGAIVIHPDNPDICYAAAIGNPFGPNPERGVFKTVDGGQSWEKVLYISDKTGISDIEMHPANPDILYASAWTVDRKPWTIISGSEEGGVYRSTDAGLSWKKLEDGLPGGIVGKSDLAVCKAEADYIYVLVEASEDRGGVYFSENMGDSFELLSKEAYLLDRPFYYTNIDVDPTDPDIIYVNSTGYYRSGNRGESWTRISTPHGDNHDMWINPSNPDIYIQSNDGGANVTLDGGVSWSSQNNQPTSELYQVNVDDQFSYWLYAGQQDNSTVAIPGKAAWSNRNNYIMAVGGCETGPAIPKPGNHNIVYSNCKGRFGVYNKITGQEKQYYVGAANIYGHNPADLKYRFQRVAPIMVSPHDPDLVYHCSQYVHLTRDDGVTWETISPDLTAFEPDKQVISGSPITRDITGEEFYSTIYAIAESPLEKGVIWTGANDGPVHITRDGGGTWLNVTPPDLPPGGRVQTIEASPHNAGGAYVAVYRYLLDDWKPYIYKTDDYGDTWTLLSDGSNGIPPDCPVRVVREDPDRKGLLYAGTEHGMYVSFDDGLKWYSLQQNLPDVPVTDIKIYRKDLILSTMGRSFWIMDNISPLHEFLPSSDNDRLVFFDPQDAFRSPERRGLYLDYYLPSDMSSALLEIRSNDGKVLKTIQGNSSAGFHRIIWDLRTDIDLPGESFSRRLRGPKVVPARYNVTLMADNERFSAGFDILPDPRIIEDGMTFSDYKEQYDLTVKVLDLYGKTASLVADLDRIPGAEGDKDKPAGRKEAKKLESLSAIRDQLVTRDDIRYPRPMLSDQVMYLYSMLSRADQKPGKDAYVRYEELSSLFESLKNQYDKLMD